MVNHPSTYRYPLYVLTDDNYEPLGAIEVDPRTDRVRVLNERGFVLNNRKDVAGAIRAAEARGYTVVSSAWYGVSTGRPTD